MTRGPLLFRRPETILTNVTFGKEEMNTRTTVIAIALAAFLAQGTCPAQTFPAKVGKDSVIIFGQPELFQAKTEEPALRLNSLGVNLMISVGGFGAGAFYRHEYTDELSGFVDVSVSEAKDDDEIEYFDYYGNRYTYGKVNRFLVIPITFGVQKRLFKEDILDNFRPYVTAGAGPTMIYVFPYNEEYFSALGKGRLKYTVGGYVGFGAFFGDPQSSLVGINLRYHFVPYPSGIESLQNTTKTDFGGIFISFSFGSAW
jgi:hypothetical protein